MTALWITLAVIAGLIESEMTYLASAQILSVLMGLRL